MSTAKIVDRRLLESIRKLRDVSVQNQVILADIHRYIRLGRTTGNLNKSPHRREASYNELTNDDLFDGMQDNDLT